MVVNADHIVVVENVLPEDLMVAEIAHQEDRAEVALRDTLAEQEGILKANQDHRIVVADRHLLTVEHDLRIVKDQGPIESGKLINPI